MRLNEASEDASSKELTLHMATDDSNSSQGTLLPPKVKPAALLFVHRYQRWPGTALALQARRAGIETLFLTSSQLERPTSITSLAFTSVRLIEEVTIDDLRDWISEYTILDVHAVESTLSFLFEHFGQENILKLSPRFTASWRFASKLHTKYALLATGAPVANFATTYEQLLLELDSGTLSFPIAAKHDFTEGGKGVRKLSNMADLEGARGDGITYDLFEQWFEGEDLIYCGLFQGGHAVLDGCYETKKDPTNDTGAAVQVRLSHQSDIVDLCRKSAKALALDGLFCYDVVKKDDGTAVILEINPRVWGSCYAMSRSGNDFVGAYLSALTAHAYSMPSKLIGRDRDSAPWISVKFPRRSATTRLGALFHALSGLRDMAAVLGTGYLARVAYDEVLQRVQRRRVSAPSADL